VGPNYQVSSKSINRTPHRKTDKQVKWHDASRSQWLEYRLRRSRKGATLTWLLLRSSLGRAAAKQQPHCLLARLTVRQQPVQGGSIVGHAKPYSSYNSWSNLLIFGHNSVHRHMHWLMSDFLICALMSKWQALRVGNRRNFPYFSIWHWEYGRHGIQKGLHESEDRYIYLPTKFGCDRSIVVGCRSWNDRQTSRQKSWNDNKTHSLHCTANVTQQTDRHLDW